MYESASPFHLLGASIQKQITLQIGSKAKEYDQSGCYLRKIVSIRRKYSLLIRACLCKQPLVDGGGIAVVRVTAPISAGDNPALGSG